MLILWRRHTKKCPHDSRESLKCKCPIWIDWTTEGRRFRKPLGLRDWQAAQQRARQIEAEGLATGSPVTTIEKAMEQFEIHLTKQRQLREPTLRKYKFLFKRLREFCTDRGIVFLSQFNAEQANDFRNTWTLGPLTHIKQLERLKAFFRFCLEMEWIKSSPVKSFKPPKMDGQQVAPFTEEEVEKILKSCDSFEGNNRQRLKALTNLLLASGLRIGDAVVISKKVITKDKTGYSLTLRTEKTGSAVTCPLPNAVAQDLLILDTGDHPFWTGKSNAEDCASHWRKAFSKLFKLAEIEGHPHRFRHTFAKRLLVAGVPVGTVSILLGHRKVAITEKHYSRWIVERQAAVDAAVRGSWVK